MQPSDWAHVDRRIYFGTHFIVRSGLEATYEPNLHGQPGWTQVTVDAHGQRIRKEGQHAPQAGPVLDHHPRRQAAARSLPSL